MQRGFSLVELSIVLVILGLLTGGILAGQSLIRAAELRSVSSDATRYMAAIHTFRDKYMSIPGDMTNATRFWGSAGGTGADATCNGAQTSGSASTCNGDGDGQIMGLGGLLHTERFMAWKHLASAGLMEGNYTGKSTGAVSSYSASSGTNVPSLKLSNGFLDLAYISGTSHNFSGSQMNNNAFSMFGAAVLPEEAWNMDSKVDDGSPVYGRFVVYKPSATTYINTCASSDLDTATYRLSSTTKDCIIQFVMR